MSDGANNILGTKRIKRKFGPEGQEREYTFSVIVLAEHAEKESYICSMRANPLEALLKALDRLPDSVKADAKRLRKLQDRLEDKCLVALASPQFVRRTLEEEFDDSLHGLAWGLWRALRDNEPDFGKPVKAEGEKIVYTSEAGREYTMTPAEGVQACLDFMENVVGNARFKELFQIRDGVENPPELGN